MELIDINELEFLGGTYDNHRVAKYGSFVMRNGVKIANKHTIVIHQGQDDIVFVSIYCRDWEHNFIVEDMRYIAMHYSGHLERVIGRHNQIVRNKTIDNVLE